MERPPLADAPVEMLEDIVADLPNDSNERVLEIKIKSSEDGKLYDFKYKLGDVRAELWKRKAN